MDIVLNSYIEYMPLIIGRDSSIIIIFVPNLYGNQDPSFSIQNLQTNQNVSYIYSSSELSGLSRGIISNYFM